MRSRNARIIERLVLLAALAGALGCSSGPGELDAALWVPEGATIEPDAFRRPTSPLGRTVNGDGSGEVAFTVPYECDAAARLVANHFGGSGWAPRKTRLREPRRETSFDSGCQRTNGGVVPQDLNPDEPHVEWIGEWEETAGDFLAYRISGRGRVVSGYAVYIPGRLRPYKP